MSRFYMSSVNSRGNTVTASGHKTGQDVHLRGWNSGIEVVAHVNNLDEDVFEVFSTSGSNGGTSRRLVGYLMGGVWFAHKEV